MSHLNRYIYVRKHEAYDIYNACKLGITSNILERDTQYTTGEIKRGNFELIFQVYNEDVRNIEQSLHEEFDEFNIKYDGGTEFFNKKIINMIEPFLISHNIEYKKLTKQEIDMLVRFKRIRKNYKNKLQIHREQDRGARTLAQEVSRTEISAFSYTPRKDQNVIIEKSINHFQQYDKGILVLMCGVGKTLISLWISQKLNTNTILIGVPNKLLLKQWENVVRIFFRDFPYLIVSGGVEIENIINFLENNKKKCIIITTYSSSHKVYSSSRNVSFIFDMKINDECHHLTSNNMKLSHTTKKYVQMLNIKTLKQLSLTATLKQIENTNVGENTNINDTVVSNDNVEYFGDIIDRKCLLWGQLMKILYVTMLFKPLLQMKNN